MSKFLKTAALVVGAVALAATGVGAAVSVGLVTATATTATIATVATVASFAAAGIAAVAALTTKPPVSLSGGSQTDFSADPQAGVPLAIGRTGTKGNIILRQAADGWSENTPNDLQDLITVLSLGPIDGYESFTSDTTAITFDAAGNAVGDFHDKMFQRTQVGLCPEPAALTVQAGASAYPTGWTPQHKLSGLAATIWRLRYDAKQRYFQNGVPVPMWVIRGPRVWDPRQDSTYPGGSGPCRANDESTWVWAGIDPARPAACNPYLQALAWCVGRHQNGKRVAGLGMPIDAIIVPDFVEGANVADAAGWSIGGVIYSRPDTKWATLKAMLQAGAGEPMTVGARIGCLVNAPRVSLGTITPADVIGDAKLAAMQPVRNRLNIVTPRYRSEAHDWEIVPADQVVVASYIVADGDERTKEIEYSLVQDVNQAATLARYDIENSRELGPGSFPLPPKWLNYKAGDCVTIDLPEVPALKVIITKRTIEPQTATVTFEVRSETDAKHAFALGQTGVAPPTASIIYDYQRNGFVDAISAAASHSDTATTAINADTATSAAALTDGATSVDVATITALTSRLAALEAKMPDAS